MRGRFSVQDFSFAKEVKLGTYSDKGTAPPGALIATKRMMKDPRTEPQYGERVPYVVIAGAPGARLWERCVEPERLIYDEYAELDAEYYISKNLIPPLERIFNLVGANVRKSNASDCWAGQETARLLGRQRRLWRATWAVHYASCAERNFPRYPLGSKSLSYLCVANVRMARRRRRYWLSVTSCRRQNVERETSIACVEAVRTSPGMRR